MARRPEVRKDEVLSPDDLRQMRQGLSRLGRSAMLQAYQTAHARCRMVNDRIPSARSMQELVQVWKQLWKLRGGISGEPRA
jgi:hypothetical protein